MPAARIAFFEYCLIVNPMERMTAKRPRRSREEFHARAKELQGKPVNWFDPKTVVACVLSQVNAPCRRRLTAEELAVALRTGNIDLMQVESYFTELDVDAQRIFAAELDVPEHLLLRTATALSECIRLDLPILAK